MRDVLHTYGFFAGIGIFAVSGWMALSALSGGSIPGAGRFHGGESMVAVSVTGPLAVACAIMAIHCFYALLKKGRTA